jgi:hypothetical protein
MDNRMTAQQLKAFYKSDGDTRAPRQDREGPIHKAILQFLDMFLPDDAIYHHSPNELDMAGPEAARQIAKARKLGTKSGWPDIEIVWQGRIFFLEVKAKTNQSEAQKGIQSDLVRCGGLYAVVRSVDEAKEILTSWGLI